MHLASADATPPTRGRVVMLVDNDIRGDSRVQKTARSAAEAGWEVILLGELRDVTAELPRIARVQIRLVPVGTQLEDLPSQYHRSVWRRPFAYAPGPITERRLELMKVRKAEIATQRAALKVSRDGGGGRRPDLAGRCRLLARGTAATVIGLWTRFRAGQAHRLRRERRDPESRLNTVPVRFWTAVMGDRSWRRLDPSLWQWELAFGKVVDDLEPDLIHAHDFRMIGVGARAALRARAGGRSVKLVWDAHEYVAGLRPKFGRPRWLPAICAYEREFAPYADAVVTVSGALADLLWSEHRLTERPAVVLNAPVRAPADDERIDRVPDLRADCGVTASTPLLAYCGGITAVRGVDTMIDALPELPGVHVALVSLHPNGKNWPADQIRDRARQLGVADRVHLLPYVPHWNVAGYIAVADAAVSPLHHLPNHEIALSNKFLEYSRARLPLIVSDVRTMAEMVRSTGQGEVYRAQDVLDYVRAVRAVLADPAEYRSAYGRMAMLETWTWEAQATILDRVYSRLLPDGPRVVEDIDDVAHVVGDLV